VTFGHFETRIEGALRTSPAATRRKFGGRKMSSKEISTDSKVSRFQVGRFRLRAKDA
jgi:hypothetical protein